MSEEKFVGDTAGIDIGSRSIELVVLKGEEIVLARKLPTTFDPLAQCAKLLQGVGADKVAATGYGRRLIAERGGLDGVTVCTEIQAYALGTNRLYPEARTILDIGGQDTKVIALTPQGRVAKFEMNDRCAAGTGKFLEFMATALQIPIEEFGPFALQADKRIEISSMCTVFAETEATSIMARGEKPANIAQGLHAAIVNRTASMLKRVGGEAPLVFAGGVARNPCAVQLLEEKLGHKVIVPQDPDMLGALGAAIHASRQE